MGTKTRRNEKKVSVVVSIAKVDGGFFNIFYIWAFLIISLSDTVCETENKLAPKSLKGLLFLRRVVAQIVRLLACTSQG